MGLFDFIKDAGKAIGFGDDEKELEKARAQMKKIEELRAKRMADNLKQEVKGFGLKAKALAVKYEEDGTVKVTGTAPDQETREKIILALGNTRGVSRVDEKIAVEKRQKRGTFHTIKKGDNLSKIARKYYGKASKYMEIFEANKPMLKHPDKIYPGQVLRIPNV
jgi:nucleoid-associated protein YgaU